MNLGMNTFGNFNSHPFTHHRKPKYSVHNIIQKRSDIKQNVNAKGAYSTPHVNAQHAVGKYYKFVIEWKRMRNNAVFPPFIPDAIQPSIPVRYYGQLRVAKQTNGY